MFLAAKILKHDYIGIDVSQSYLDMTAERLKNYRQEYAVWAAEKKLHAVKESAGERKQAGKFQGKFSPARVRRHMPREVGQESII